MRSLLTLIVILCSLTEEKLLSFELQLKVMLNCGNTILVDNATELCAKLCHTKWCTVIILSQ